MSRNYKTEVNSHGRQNYLSWDQRPCNYWWNLFRI